jgi:transcriptional regulator with GAF, ATPase, and Fis domain
VLNCAAIPEALLEAELFGHTRGAFTGAVQSRTGRIEAANGGTLFLDEIGELPPAAQVRLLRILQDGTFERVGGQRTLTVDVRLVAATHTDLYAMVPVFAAHFAARAGRRLGGVPLVPTAEDVALLLRYPWPGNVRELAAVIERAAILGNGRNLEVAQALGPPPGQASQLVSQTTAEVPAVTRSLERVAVDHIRSALTASHGRIEGPFGAAEALGVNPHTLRSRLRKYGVDVREFRRSRSGSPKQKNAPGSP